MKTANQTDSAIYQGKVRHRRFFPKAHHFDFPLFMVWLNLDQIDQFLNRSFWWGKKKFWPASFQQQNYLQSLLPFNNDCLKSRAKKLLKDKLNKEADQIFLMTHFRYFGLAFNPISCFYCFKNNQLQAIIAEVSNTPWKEAIHYVLDCSQPPQQEKQKIWFDKKMHVSPFNPLDMHYQWYSNTPQKQFNLHLETHDPRGRVMDATLTLERIVASKKNLQKVLWQFPLMTLKVVWGIYWQAVKLWVKKVPLFDHQSYHYPTAVESYQQGSLRAETLNKDLATSKSATSAALAATTPQPTEPSQPHMDLQQSSSLDEPSSTEFFR